MSGLVASRLYSLLPPRMPLEAKYKLTEVLWRHVGPSSKKTLRVGSDASIDAIVEIASKHIDEVVTEYKIPDKLERRFEWLSSGVALPRGASSGKFHCQGANSSAPPGATPMHDIVIRGGTIIDGTGKAPFSGDVAIAGGRIAAVGGKLGPGKREIDAAGLMVTPGWVDVHTHYDGQAMWDPLLSPSCWHGVTTVMFGNCGVGFAPVKKEHRGALMDLMEGVEEIPNPVLAAGLNWEWETFPQFMDELERRPRAIDICAQAAHLPTRVYVMGDRALRREPATPDDIAEMRKITVEALRAGAFGFTTSRTDSHKTPDGELVPSRDADDYELLGIGQALGITGTGAFGMNSDFDDEDFELRWIRKQARETGRPVWFLLTDRYSDPQRWRRLITAVHGMRAQGLPVTAQMAGRPIGVMMGIGTALNPFTVRPSYKKLESLPIEEQRNAAARSAGAAANSRRDAVGGRDCQAGAVPSGGRQGF